LTILFSESNMQEIVALYQGKPVFHAEHSLASEVNGNLVETVPLLFLCQFNSNENNFQIWPECVIKIMFSNVSF